MQLPRMLRGLLELCTLNLGDGTYTS
ncbi:hypothetical protein C5167_009269 [Papaver somniferum]|uniref:Uncharacterized protein n=1 Tax=Papaver somniferum TaxID=3469 RepID=A0A4Y7JZU4_PAPSO|nr:hypothetical protein C5167_009269 [Papaver somniferum]